ncbi:hypothetical protein K1719_009004 [Acacia pycnantha]|nr:hypothetical protein K1719_009004 [Acacia pycnantha]
MNSLDGILSAVNFVNKIIFLTDIHNQEEGCLKSKMNWVAESGKNWVEMAKNGFGKSQSWAEEKIREKGISDEHRDLVVKGGGALLLSPAIAYYGGFGSAFWFIQKYAASDYYCCEMANNGFEKSKSWAEEKIREKGISDEHRDLVVKGGGALLLAPAIGYYGGLGSAFRFIQKYAASDNNGFDEKSRSWVEMAKNGFEKSRSWAEEKIREKGISDEHRDLVVKGGGALLLAAAMGYYGGLGGACGFIFRGGGGSGDGEKLMKAPGRPGEFIARAAFEANPRAYFRGLHGKLP